MGLGVQGPGLPSAALPGALTGRWNSDGKLALYMAALHATSQNSDSMLTCILGNVS